MIKLIKNLRQAQNQEMQKGCTYDSCGSDGSSCPSIDYCYYYDLSDCTGYEDDCHYDYSGGGCILSDVCYIDRDQCYGESDWD